MSIFNYNDVDFSKINHTVPEKTGLVYYSGISYKNEPLYIQTPKLKCLHNGKYCMDKKSPSLDIENINNDFKFYDFLLQLDNININNTYESSEAWFQKEIPRDTIDEMYKRILKPVKKESRPTYTFKIPTNKGKAQCPVFDQHKICHDITKCQEDIEVELILHVRGLKFLKQNFYCDTYISQIKIYVSNEEKYSIIKDYSFHDNETEDVKEDINEDIKDDIKEEKLNNSIETVVDEEEKEKEKEK